MANELPRVAFCASGVHNLEYRPIRLALRREKHAFLPRHLQSQKLVGTFKQYLKGPLPQRVKQINVSRLSPM